MDRRESLKALLVGTVAGATLTGAAACKEGETGNTAEVIADAQGLYGRLPEEIERDKRVMASEFLNEHELETIAVLCDIILPATPSAKSANDAKVPEFIEFIVKDIPSHQLPMRGGIAWLDVESNQRYNKEFKSCSDEEQIAIIEDIAYPDPDGKKPDMSHGIRFFELIRGLTLTGYYTTRMGFDDLGYKGNYANEWDGVPPEVLAEHDVDYDEEWLSKCVDQSKREVIAEWDDEMNLIT